MDRVLRHNRPAPSARRFVSSVVDREIERIAQMIGDDEIRRLFCNCLPNTLDTAVEFAVDSSGCPDTFIITGDIPAMWLRDSVSQVWPYLQYVGRDPLLEKMFVGLIRRLAKCIMLDPYANAFARDESAPTPWHADRTEMKPGVFERKYELDSLCSFFRLSVAFFDAVGARDGCFDENWMAAVRLACDVIENGQAGTGETAESCYRFTRLSHNPLTTLARDGRGLAVKRCGLSASPFRPSDDAGVFPFLVPANAMAAVVLDDASGMLTEIGQVETAERARRLAQSIREGLRRNAIVHHPTAGPIYAYEVDGFGSCVLADDPNLPSLLSLPYLGFCAFDDPIYLNTRSFILSGDNPGFAASGRIEGNISSHGRAEASFVWPMSVIVRALTTDDADEIEKCLFILKTTHDGTGFMHESFCIDNPADYTRPWFCWANSLFGELILRLSREYPELLKETIR